MIKMSFYDNTLDKDKLKDFIKNTDKQIKYTYGLKFRGPSTYEVPISKEEALKIVDNQSLLDATENADFLDLNAYSGNDMW